MKESADNESQKNSNDVYSQKVIMEIFQKVNQSINQYLFVNQLWQKKIDQKQNISHLFSFKIHTITNKQLKQDLSFELSIVLPSSPLPIKYCIILQIVPNHTLLDEIIVIFVIRLLVKPQLSSSLQHHQQLLRQCLTQHLGRVLFLLLHDLLVFLLFSLGLLVLPRQNTQKEIGYAKQHAFDVISSTGLDAEMGVQRGVPSSACETPPVLIFHVFAIFHVFFGQSKINNINLFRILGDTHEEVVRLHISMDDPSTVNILQSLQHLLCDHHRCLHRELLASFLKQIFKRRSKQIHYQYVIFSFSRVVIHIRNPFVDGWIVEEIKEDSGLSKQLRMFG